ncbi:MAG: hydroxyethylthiazole kinase [Lachnospirales bacterium]
MFKEVFENMTKSKPIIHSITNYVTVNDCANIILASGGSPIMSDEIEDIEDVISFSDALVINTGTLNARTVESMIFAGKLANKRNIPVVLDPVGIGATKFRNDVVDRLLSEIKFSVIKGNVSELKFLILRVGNTKGVDVFEKDITNVDNLQSNINLFKKLSEDTNSIIVATGEIDIITDKEKTYIVKNGSSFMGKITGAGCMLGSVIACYVATNNDNILDSCTFAVSAFGLSGEIAEQNCQGNGSFRVALIDNMSTFNYEDLKGGMKIENY